MPKECPGCFAAFSAAGLARHLAQTTNLACIDASVELNDLFDNASVDNELDSRRSNSPDAPMTDSSPRASLPPQFAGDYFGDYDEDDLEWPVLDLDIPHLDHKEDFSDSEIEQDTESLEPGWEPDPPAPEAFDDCDIPMEYEIPPSSPDQDHLNRQGIEDRLWSTPVIETFPIATAGKVYGHETENSYHCAQKQFAGSNGYQPFASQIEWEIARWAKLRGPSSTAFTELLEIEGVSGLATT